MTRSNIPTTGNNTLEVDANPFEQFRLWMREAENSKLNMPDAFHLSTVGSGCRPSGRILLLKGVNDNGFVFFTNYKSRKGSELDKSGFGAMTFFWVELYRQVRIEGEVGRIDGKESDIYFDSRPFSSKVGAVASDQSMVLENRELLDKRVKYLEREFREKPVARPAHWGGYILIPDSFEFWQGREHRLHDRVLYTFDEEGNWTYKLLYP